MTSSRAAVVNPVEYTERIASQTDMQLLQFNMFVDTFFCIEVCMTFFVGVIDKGTYVDDFRTVARIYLTGRFWFDIVTSLPTSWADWAGTQNCHVDDDADESQAVQALRFVRVLKPIRLVKLLRIFKVARIFDILDRILRLSPHVIKVGKLTFGVTLLTHLFSCVFWLLKSQTDPNFMDFAESHSVAKGTVAEKWLLSMYFINTVFTTVGFGDISGDTNVDRIFCVVIMWAGTAVFAIIINGLQQAGEEINEKNKLKNDHIQTVVRFMRDKKVPMWLEQEVKSWVAFQHESNERIQERNKVMENLPERLQKSLCLQINSHLLSEAWIFHRLTHVDAGELLKRLVLKTTNSLRFKGEMIASEDEEANVMYIVEHGLVRVELTLKEQQVDDDAEPPHDVLRRGDWFGELSLVGCKSWGGAYGVQAEFIAQENCELIELSRDAFEEVLDDMPESLYHEIYRKAYEVWGGMNRTGIQLASQSGSTELKAQAIRTRWEILTRAMLAKHEASSRFGHVLLNFATRRTSVADASIPAAPLNSNIPPPRRRRSSARHHSPGPLSAKVPSGGSDEITEEGAGLNGGPQHPHSRSAHHGAAAAGGNGGVRGHGAAGQDEASPHEGHGQGSGPPLSPGNVVAEIGLVTKA
mmetsp:Transcript_28073/g.56569  ORF Transcript_28073/g.56569 Transcript_28073/m.56569 type:complete len:639 (+) Transcript_28073:600-2516(+)